MRGRFQLVAIVFAFSAAASAVRADLVNISALKDNTLYENDFGSLSNGAGAYLFAGHTSQGPNRRALLAFDIDSAIPNGSTINSATLTLHMSRCGLTCFTNFQFNLHKVTQDWGEGISDAGDPGGDGTSSEPGDATWIHTFYDTNTWTNPGGDFVAAPSASTPVGGIGFYSWSSGVMASDVQSWLGTGQSYGWILVGDESASLSAKRFDSREYFSPNFRPILTIDFTPIPEPATLLFVGLGMVAVLRTKRSLKRN